MLREYKLKIDWLMLFIIMLPTFYLANQDLRLAQENFFQISIILMVALFHVNRFFGYFLAWSVFQFVFFKDAPQYSATLQNIFLASILYHFIVRSTSLKDLKKYYWAFIALLILNLVWCLRQYLQIDPIFVPSNLKLQTLITDPGGFFSLAAFLGNYVAAIFPLLLSVSYWLAPLGIIAIVISKSTFSVVGLLAGALFFFWFKKRIAFWIILILGVLSSSFYVLKYDMPSGQFGRRLKAWKVIETNAFQKQFFGHGVGAFSNFILMENNRTTDLKVLGGDLAKAKEFFIEQAIKLNNRDAVEAIMVEQNPHNLLNVMESKHLYFERWSYAHNEFLQAFYDSGLIGLVIIGFYIFNLLSRFFRYGTKDIRCVTLASCFIAMMICASGHFPFHVARLCGPYLVLMAFFDLSLINAKLSLEDQI